MRPISNPPNPWASHEVEWIDAAPPAKLEVFEEHARSILSENASPDIGFRFSINPYRGCAHACNYCYARPTHQYLDFGAGTDFDRKIVVKVNAPELLRESLRKKSWAGDVIMFSGNTDCYQPLEASYQLTRRLLQVCLDYRNPVGIITKGALIRRDVDILCDLARDARVHVSISIAFADDAMSKKVEPGAPRPSKRFEVMKILADAGIEVGVGVAPIIPGLNDGQIAEILERARDAGATSAFRQMLRLAAEVKPVFLERLHDEFPDREKKVIHAIQDVREGAMYRSGFGERMNGKGPRWDALHSLFELTCRRLGLNAQDEDDVGAEASRETTTFRRAVEPGDQLALFAGVPVRKD